MDRDLAREFWNRMTARLSDADDPSRFGTVTEDADVVRLRDELERRHVNRFVRISSRSRVLDIGGGAGRFAIPFARRAARVTLVDVSDALVAAAVRRAAEVGITNLTCVAKPAQEFVPEDRYDLVLVMGLCTYLTDAELEVFAQRITDCVAPKGMLIVKEPVSTDDTLRIDRGRHPDDGYLAYFRPRDSYARIFGRSLSLRYQSATLAHLIPWFLEGTNEAVSRTRSQLRTNLLSAATPIVAWCDPAARRVEAAMRRTPLLHRVLAPIPVLNDLYVFEKDAR